MICTADTWIGLPASGWDHSHPVIMQSLPIRQRLARRTDRRGSVVSLPEHCGGAGLAWSGGGVGGGISRFHCFSTVLPVFSFLPPVDSALQFSTGCLGESLQSSGREEKLQQSIRLLVWCEGMFGSQLGGTEVGVKQQGLPMNMWRFHL